MIMKNIITILTLITVSFSYGQEENFALYDSLVKDAWALYDARQYEASGQKYLDAIAALDGKAYEWDRYNAACALTLAGETDTAFFHLFRLAEGATKYSNLYHLKNDKDLSVLHDSPKWNKLLGIVEANKIELEKDYDHELIAILDSVLITDQKYREEIGPIREEFGWESDEMKILLKKMKEVDSLNLATVRNIIDERGWLGPNVIGENGASALFLVIQHSDTETQLVYLPIMRKAVEEGNAYAADLALLEDRVALAQGKKQIYGSQIEFDEKTGEYFVSPIENPEEVDQRRREVGLGSITEYASHFGIVWDLEKHKSRSAK